MADFDPSPMKLLLIEPNTFGRVGLPTINLPILKGYVEGKSDHLVRIVDLAFNQKDWQEQLEEIINRESPDLVGFSVMAFNFIQALDIARFVKSKKDVKIIFGGVHAILAPEEVAAEDMADIICIGEGEIPLVDILDNRLNCEGIGGIWYKDAVGRLIKNPPIMQIADLDEVPFPAWDDFEVERYFFLNNRHVPIMAGRGCPYQCTYCSSPAIRKTLQGQYVRFRSPDNVLDEVEYLIDKYYDKGMRYLIFYDDIFVIRKSFVLEFCQKYIERGFHKKVKWCVNVRANLIVKDEMLAAMKLAGCYEVAMGIESGNDYIRNEVYKRNMKAEQIDKAVANIRKHDLQLRVQFILGAPYETIEMMEESLQMAKRINPDAVQFPILMPLPSTEIRDVCVEEGLIEVEGFKSTHVMFTSPVTRTKFAERKEILSVVRKARFYQMKKAFLDGVRLKGVVFLWDLLMFFLYYMPKYGLVVDNAWKFTVNEYNLQRIEKQYAKLYAKPLLPKFWPPAENKKAADAPT